MPVIRGTNYSEKLYGSSYNDTIYAYSGHDVIYGYAGNDLIYGDAGDDLIYGDAGNDKIYGGSGNDDLIGGAGTNDLYGGIGADWFIMSARTNTSSDDYVGDFQFGIDKIDVASWGISDFNQLKALLKTDKYGDAYFNAFYNGYDHYLTVAKVNAAQLISSDFIYSNSGSKNQIGTSYDDTMFGSRFNDTLNGGSGNDILLGGIGNDRLLGGNGHDDLIGGAGYDVMTGGAGKDVFIFQSAADSQPTVYRDRITDFDVYNDFIDLSAIDARANVGGNQAFQWIGGGNFTNSGQLKYGWSGSDTIISANTDTDAAPEFQIVLSGRHYLVGSDFVL